MALKCEKKSPHVQTLYWKQKKAFCHKWGSLRLPLNCCDICLGRKLKVKVCFICRQHTVASLIPQLSENKDPHSYHINFRQPIYQDTFHLWIWPQHKLLSVLHTTWMTLWATTTLTIQVRAWKFEHEEMDSEVIHKEYCHPSSLRWSSVPALLPLNIQIVCI